jgi:hypothetical protein
MLTQWHGEIYLAYFLRREFLLKRDFEPNSRVNLIDGGFMDSKRSTEVMGIGVIVGITH